jgi:hypothetical protein
MIAYIKTIKNIADIMTKQSAGPQFAQHQDYALGIHYSTNNLTAAVVEILHQTSVYV